MQEDIAKITSTALGYEDHGMFSFNVSFTYGASSQGTGHYCICSENSDQDWDAAGIRIVKGIIDACGVDRWEKLVGRTVIVVRDDGQHGQIRGIKPLPTEKGREFMFAEVVSQFEEVAA